LILHAKDSLFGVFVIQAQPTLHIIAKGKEKKKSKTTTKISTVLKKYIHCTFCTLPPSLFLFIMGKG
jgi:hypothetical protein